MRAILSVCLALFAVIAVAVPRAQAQFDNGILTIGLAESHVGITTGFGGAQITLFGVKKEQGDLAVVIKGPEREMVVRRKDHVAGIWMNGKSLRFQNVPAYYDIALASAEQDIAPADVRVKYGIGLSSLDFNYSGREDEEIVKTFREALIRNKQSQGHFPLTPKNIFFLSSDFFKVSFFVPASMPTGDYTVQAFLFRGGELTSMRETILRVGQEGFSAGVYSFAHGQSLLYGLAAVLLALAAGWAAWAFVQRD